MRINKSLGILVSGIMLATLCEPRALNSILFNSMTVIAETLTAGDFSYTINKDGTGVTLSKYNGVDEEVVIPEMLGSLPLTRIGDEAFLRNNTMRSVSIPDTVTYIGINAFRECDGLTSVVIPDSVTTMDSFAFYSCQNLTDVVLSKNIEWLCSYQFEDCSKLKNITIPNGVKGIGISEFRNCISLTCISIPDSVAYISYDAFKDCIGLTSIYIPASVTELYTPFYGCKNLTIYGYENSSAQDEATKYSYVLFHSLGEAPPITTTTTTTTTISETTTTSSASLVNTTSTSEQPQMLKGDYNDDGEVTVADAVLLARFIAEDITLTSEQVNVLIHAQTDLNNDSLLSISDLRILLTGEEFIGNTPITTTAATTTDNTTTTTTTTSTSEIWVESRVIEDGSMYYIITDVEGRPGEEVQIPVCVYGDTGTCAIRLYLKYDECLQSIKITDPESNSAYNSQWTISYSNPICLVTLPNAGYNVKAKDGSILFYINCTIPEDAAPGTIYRFYFDSYTSSSDPSLKRFSEIVTCIDYENSITEALNVALYGGSITVTEDAK